MGERILALDGVSNFRDFGGYATASGGRLRSGRLFRSAHHARASDADLEAIAALNIAVVVDLRRAQERTRDPSRRHPTFAGEVIDNDIGDGEEDPWHAFIRSSDLSPAAFRGHAMDYYRIAPFEARHVDLFKRYFRKLAESDEPILIHCAAGKDRTGLLAALTHHLVGVHPDDILADYLLTNQATDFDRLVPMVAELIAEQTGRRPELGAVRLAMSVEPAYLESGFAAIIAAHGAIEAYFTEVLGLDAALRRRLEARLVA